MLGLDIFENGNYLLETAKEDRRIDQLKLASMPHRVIHRENKLKVLLYEKNAEVDERDGRRRPPIMIIPSFINRHYILDLMPDKSLVRFLANQGFDVATIDWGAPGDEDKFVTFERYVDTYLKRSIAALNKATGKDKPVLLGYCLGGTMAVIHAALRPETISGLIALTAPINFHNSGMLSAWCKAPSYDIEGLVKAFGNIPWPLMQSTFNMLRPTMGAARALSVLKRLKDKDYVDSSLALELWLNDNVSFPGECYREMITALYRENSLVNDTLRLGGTRKVEFKSITCPILNVAASEDHIVPLDASRALAGLTSSEDYTELITPGGHIGAVISKKASAHLWPNMVMWLESRFMNEHSVANAANAQATATAAAAAAAVTAQTVEVTVQSRMGANAARGKILRGKGLRHSTEFKKAPILPQSEGPAGEPEVRTRIRPWQAPLT